MARAAEVGTEAAKFQALISSREAARGVGDPGWLFVDCRFALKDPEWGARDYARSHIRGALYAHLDRDLSGPVIAGRTGRHPLPSPEALARTFSAWGITPETQVVAYDESNGAMTAARLWWLLRWAGHDAAAVLDGGIRAWEAAGLPLDSGAGAPPRAPAGPPALFQLRLRPELVMDAEAVQAAAVDPSWAVLDARGADRYRGENETIDPVAGHIPGAVSAPYLDNVEPDGRFKDAQALRGRLGELAGGRDAAHVVVYCGSGVTAAHEALAFVHAGMGMPRLYPGSWSHWITDPGRPVARGGRKD